MLVDAKIIAYCLSSPNRSFTPDHDLLDDYELYYQHQLSILPAPSTALLATLILVIFACVIIAAVVGGLFMLYKRYYRTRITSGEDAIGFENQSYLRDNDSVDLGNTGFTRDNRSAGKHTNGKTQTNFS